MDTVTASAVVDRWLADLEARHLANLSFAEVTRGLRALSSAYVERRGRLSDGAALSGEGKRAAFALFYGPLHYLLVQRIVRDLPGSTVGVRRIADLGCGTGVAGAAWARACDAPPSVRGFDRHPWALKEAAATYRALGLHGRTHRFDLEKGDLPEGSAAVVLAFAVNELQDAARDRLRARLIDRHTRGDRVLVVEPIARSAAPWWPLWQVDFERAGGRADEWRLDMDLPSIVARLDRAAGLRHDALTARSLWL